MHFLDPLRKKYNYSRPALIQCYETLDQFVQNLGTIVDPIEDVNIFEYPPIRWKMPTTTTLRYFTTWDEYFAAARQEMFGNKSSNDGSHNNNTINNNITSHSSSYYPTPIFELHQNNCQNFARAAVHNQVPAMEHLYYNYQHLRSLLQQGPIPHYSDHHHHHQQHQQQHHDIKHKDNHNATTTTTTRQTVLFVARTEYLQQDWFAINRLLGMENKEDARTDNISSSSSSSTSYFPKTKRRQIGKHFQLRVPNVLSEALRPVLCRALQSEYEAYEWFLQQAVNLRPADIQACLRIKHQNCPELD